MIRYSLTSGELVDIQWIDNTNSTKLRLPLLSLSNVENIILLTLSTVSAGNNILNMSFTCSSPSVPCKTSLNVRFNCSVSYLRFFSATSGHSPMNCWYQTWMSSSEKFVLVSRKSISSSVNETFLCLLLTSEAFHLILDFIQDRTVEIPGGKSWTKQDFQFFCLSPVGRFSSFSSLMSIEKYEKEMDDINEDVDNFLLSAMLEGWDLTIERFVLTCCSCLLTNIGNWNF